METDRRGVLTALAAMGSGLLAGCTNEDGDLVIPGGGDGTEDDWHLVIEAGDRYTIAADETETYDYATLENGATLRLEDGAALQLRTIA